MPCGELVNHPLALLAVYSKRKPLLEVCPEHNDSEKLLEAELSSRLRRLRWKGAPY